MIWIDGVLVSPGEGGVVYGERMLQGYRIWDPYRSKLSALYHLGTGVELRPEMRVLYLGAAHGTTVSHVADYVDTVYAVEIAPRPTQDLLEVARDRRNVVPILADATRPQEYAPLVESVDLIYQDVAHPDQAEIALRNQPFLKERGQLILVLKTRSVDVAAPPEKVAEMAADILTARYAILARAWLFPYHKDHAAFICEALK